MKTTTHLIFSVFFFFIVLSLGAYGYHHVEGWGWLDSIYFVSVTVTTIGYGDFVPKTDIGKIFTIFFSFFGISMAFYFFSVISSSIFKFHLSKKILSIEHLIKRKEEVNNPQ